MKFSSSPNRPSTWKEMKLADVCKTFTSGGTPSRKKPEYFENGTVPWVRTKELNDGVITEVEEFITVEALKNSSAKILPKDTVLLAMYGATVGKLGVLGIESSCNQACAAMVPKDGIVDYRFLYFLLLNHRALIIGQATGGAQQNLSGELIKGFTFDFPTYREQVAISDVLWRLEEKIRVNSKLSKTLEELAQNIFRSWFIDFDPVNSKMAGEEPLGIDAETASLFPDSMIDSGGEKIPLGWRNVAVSDLCDSVVNGSTPLRSNSEFWNQADMPWFKTGELSDNFLFDSKESITSLALERTSAKTLPKGGVLMAIYAAPTVGRLGILTQESSFNQACTGMIPKAQFGTAYLYFTLFNRRAWFNSLAIGAAQQNISKGVVENCPAIIAPLSVHEEFREVTDPIFSKMEFLALQNRSLARIRDSLLPRLMSGELQIPEEMLAS